MGFASKISSIQKPKEQPKKNFSAFLQNTSKGDVGDRGEMDRILSLPREELLSDEDFAKINARVLKPEIYAEGRRLFTSQAKAIYEYLEYSCMVGGLGVGNGKSLTGLIVAQLLWSKGVHKILYLMPSKNFNSYPNYHIPFARKVLPELPPFVPMGGLDQKTRMRKAKSDRPGVYLFPYSYLSTTDAEDLINEISPIAVISDEAHNLANAKSARTKRLFRFIKDKSPLFYPMSGTMTKKKLLDHAHLLRAALGDLTPLPRSGSLLKDWGRILDSDSVFQGKLAARMLDPLRYWAQREFPEGEFPPITSGYREAYQMRLKTAPGVVISGESECEASLNIFNWTIPDPTSFDGYDKIQELIGEVEQFWRTPNGDEIDWAIHKFKWLKELSSGFYNELIWPTDEEVADHARDHIDIREARSRLERAKAHHKIKQGYNRELRDFLHHRSRKGYDTPLLVDREIARNGNKRVGHTLAAVWRKMRDMEFDGMPKRVSRAVRVCDYKIRAATVWAESVFSKKETEAIWYENIEIGLWLVEELRKVLGRKRVVHCPAGAKYNTIAEDSKNNKGKVLVCSFAHAEGTNMQYLAKSFVVQWPRPAQLAHQLLGRHHRTGQLSDSVDFWRCVVTDFDHLLMAGCLNDALYAHETSGLDQKTILAAYDPMPKIYSPGFLRARGDRVLDLNFTERRKIRERFGEFSDG